jgi:predicted Rossmann fold flavoprotein
MTIAIIGGGASGIAAALSAKRTNTKAHVILLEGLDRVGKKILATGNGRCNLGNADITAKHYHSHDAKRLRELLKSMPSEMTVDFFRSIDLMCATEEMGRIYPYCRQAAMVLDILQLALSRAEIDVRCGQQVTGIQQKKGRFLLRIEDQPSVQADKVILACGGKAAPKQGVTGIGYLLAQSLGHSATKLFPHLVPLQCTNMPKGLKGIRVEGELSLLDESKRIGAELGEIQLTDYGLSGIPAMQLSCLLDRCRKPVLQLDFFPTLSETELLQMLKQQIARNRKETLETALLGTIQKRVLFALLKQLHIEPLSRKADSLSEKEIMRLARTLKSWTLPVTGTLTWEQAQVTGGGVPLSEIHEDFSSCKCNGLYLTGELLDVSGDCGGYNLHWAWCSGIIAGTAAAE